MKIMQVLLLLVAIATVVNSRTPDSDACMRRSLATNVTLHDCALRAGILSHGFVEKTVCRDTAHRADYLCFFDGVINCFGGKLTALFQLGPENDATFKGLSHENAFDFFCASALKTCECALPPDTPAPVRAPSEPLFSFLAKLVPAIGPFCGYVACVDNLPEDTCKVSKRVMKAMAKTNIEQAAKGMPAGLKDEFDVLIDEACNIGVADFQKDCATLEVQKPAFQSCMMAPLRRVESMNYTPTCSDVDAIVACLNSNIGANCNHHTALMLNYAMHFEVAKLPFRCGTQQGIVG